MDRRIVGDVPPVDPLRVIRLTPGQIRRLLNEMDRRWTILDAHRGGDDVADWILSEQQEIEAIQAELRRAL